MEPLPDPLGDREIKDILAPPQKQISAELLYIKKSSMCIFNIIQRNPKLNSCA